MKDKADNLYDNLQWEDAYIAYDEFAKKSNISSALLQKFSNDVNFNSSFMFFSPYNDS